MIKKLKEKLMSEDWTEGLQLGLENIDQEDAKIVVESMTDHEIWEKVNIRKFQEDYIADYLEYLWELSESSFWSHVVVLLDDSVGGSVLWSDNMFYFKKLCDEEIPSDVLEAVLNISTSCTVDSMYDMNIEIIGCVIKAQVEKFDRIFEIDRYVKSLDKSLRHEAKVRIKKMINSECNHY